jgi:aspartate racemase
MAGVDQQLVPGIVGISTYVDCVYQQEMQALALAAANPERRINSLRLVTVTLDFERFVLALDEGRPDVVEEQIAAAATALEAAGADFLVVTSGTGSTLTERAREQVAIPILEMPAAIWGEVTELDVEAVGLLSTSQAAAGGIFHAVAERNGVRLVTPAAATAEQVDALIFEELVCGQVPAEAVDGLLEAIAELREQGAEAVVLGNTDMTLAADALRESSPLPLVDAARAHARAAARVALRGKNDL